MQKRVIKQLADYYKNHMLNDIMPFWDKRCIDNEYGGYFTCFDRIGNLTDDKKYIWFQGRQTYTYALLYNRVEKREEWLKKAEHGYHFLVEKAYAGNGRFNYLLDRKGNVLVGTTSIFADMHVIQGLGEYMTAIDCKDVEGMKILKETYDTLERNFNDRYFKEIYECNWQENHLWHDMYMTMLSSIICCIKPLGLDYIRPFMDECLDKICNWFAKDEYKMLLETVSWDNKVMLDKPEDRFANPGHMSEACWFLLDYANIIHDEELAKKALKFEDWTYEVGYDEVNGGVISYLDITGAEPVAIDWYLETNSLWDDKVWWANAEQLCALAMASEKSNSEVTWNRFLRHHEFCKDRFYDPEYGEWYERLHADGSVKVADKGTSWKCAFHLIRALVYTWEALERMAK